MKTIFIHLMATVILSLSITLFPNQLVSPGFLSKGHQPFQENCLTCHTPFMGTREETCMACHPLEQIGISTKKGIQLKEDRVWLRFHAKLLKTSCIKCHTEHGGGKSTITSEQFSHDLLNVSIRNNCILCHGEKKPEDRLHQYVSTTCGSCHRSSDFWQKARFNHSSIIVSVQKKCIQCHGKKRPGDTLHRGAGNSCHTCHTTQNWKSSSFKHENFFRFDKHHPSKCMDCHFKERPFSNYSCYKCHEHSQREIAKEHREEGIYDFKNCTVCHKSGDEDEAERLWKKKRSDH